MVKIDLITGFLGAGKTTFIKQYVSYLQRQNEKICILENDYGSINVDTLLLSELKENGIGVEMVCGGADSDCHRRRLKTKLITLAMLGYHRVIVEPSGIFDVDEFFDILQEDPLYDRYQIGNIIAIVDANLEENVSDEANYMLASEVASAGKIVFSKVQLASSMQVEKTLQHINQALQDISCKRVFTKDNCIIKDWSLLDDEDYKILVKAGYKESAFIKKYNIDDSTFTSLFFMNVHMNKQQVLETIDNIWKKTTLGNIIRIKGFIKEGDLWQEINATKEHTEMKTSKAGQDIIIVIGENLKEESIAEYFPSNYSTIHTK